MFELIADLVRGMGLPWNGAAYLVIVAVVLFVVLKTCLKAALFCSYLLVYSLRRAKKELPGAIYAAEAVMHNVLTRLKAGLWIWIALVFGWMGLFLARGSLEGEKLVALERNVTTVVAGWVQTGS